MANQIYSTADLFKPGSTVKIVTVFDEIIIGEVFAFDFDSRLVILKIKNSNSNNKLNNITIVNLDNCRDIKSINDPDVKKDSEIIDSIKLPDIDFSKLEQRVKNAVDERQTLAKSFRSSAGTDGVLLYHQLIKTFGETHVQWNSDSIIVKGNVIISAPYKTNSISARNPKEKLSDDSISYVKTIVEKFWVSHVTNETSSLTLKPVATSSETLVQHPASVPLTAAAVVKMNTSSPAKHNQTKDSIASTPKPLRV